MSDNLKLNQEEQELLESYERDEWRSVGSLREISRSYQTTAIAILESVGLVSIVLSKDDLNTIQQKAKEIGITNQAFIAKIVHQYVTGSLAERDHGV